MSDARINAPPAGALRPLTKHSAHYHACFFPLHAQYAHTGFMTSIGAHEVSAVLGAAALLGPGRSLLVEGATALWRCGRLRVGSVAPLCLGGDAAQCWCLLEYFWPALSL